MDQDSIWLARTELYEHLWAEPMTRIAARLGVSSAKLVEACKTMGIPRPSQGHWTLIASGRTPERAPLPPLAEGGMEKVQIFKTAPPSPKPAALERPPEPASEHPLITKTRRALKSAKPEARGTVLPSGQVLAIRVTPSVLPRALEIFGRLLQRLEANGVQVSLEERGSERTSYDEPGWLGTVGFKTSVAVNGTKLSVSLEEKLKMSRKPIPPGERRSRGFLSFKTHVEEYEATGQLTFRLHGMSRTRARRSWGDTPTTRLEEKVEDIAAGVLVAIEARRINDEARERDYQARRERERRAVGERLRAEHAFALAERLDKADQLRRLVSAAQERGPSNETMQKWAVWVEALADELDPLTASGDVTRRFTVPDRRLWLPAGWPEQGSLVSE